MSLITLFGWPAASALPGIGRGIEVLGVPSDAGNGIASGCRFAPESVRRASLNLPRPGIEGVDHGDCDFIDGSDWADVLVGIERAVATVAGRKSLCVVLGGDHSISYAVAAGLCKACPINVLWLDAHTDFCHWPGGQGHNHKQVLRRISGLKNIARILQIGHRGITYVDESGFDQKMTVVTAREAAALPADLLLDFLSPDEPVYLSVDIDAVDPKWAPGTGHPVPGGLSPQVLSDIARLVASNRNVIGVDMMEVNPLLDREGVTSGVAANFLLELLSAWSAGKYGPESERQAASCAAGATGRANSR